jgi:DNA-binding transcriptional MocR family regulator
MKHDLSIQTAQVHVDPRVIDLGVGQPQPSLLPLERLWRAANHRFSQGDPNFLQYGAEQGDGYLRLALSKFLSLGYRFPVEAESLFITSGASMGLDLLCTLFTRPGDTIFVEEPTYFLALRLFEDHGLKPVAIPVDRDGLVVEALEKELERSHPVFLYTVPAYQNPGGFCLSESRRERLAVLSREHHFTILADEVYQLLSYIEQPPRPFAGFIHEGNVISIGSFSKILAPGLRLGWIEADNALIKKLAGSGLLDSGGGLNPFTSAIVRGLVENGELMENIEGLRATYHARLQAMDKALQQYLPGALYDAPQGGYFFWVRLPDGMDASTLLPTAEALQVSYRPGIRFSSLGGLRDYVRLCFAFYEETKLVEGVQRLAQAVDHDQS